VTPHRVFLFVVLGGAAGACARYTPAPLDPAGSAQDLTARRLDDPVLGRYFLDHGAEVPELWAESDLVLAAYHFQPALESARAHRRAAEAALVTAGARARPDVEAEAGYGFTGTDAVESPWVVALASVFALELGGKRGARIAAARARAAAAELEVDATAVKIGRAVLAAVWELDAAGGRVEQARMEREAAEAIAGGARARYARGEAGSTEVSAAEAGVLEARAQEAASSARVPRARAALAATIGVPAAALDGAQIRAMSPHVCAPDLPADSLRRSALVQRVEVGQALAAYAIAEADLRLAVSGSYPDLALGPGFTWDQGVARWSVLLGLPRLPLDGNRGPISQTVAQRESAAAAVAAAQLQVLADVENAITECAAARIESAGADSVVAAAEHRLETARQSYRRGEAGAADTVGVLLPLARARAASAEARRRESAAALALEGAVAGGAPRPRVDARLSARENVP
jgi:cobalt-zinc-cadmium efflux system outer membrane protein